jgi:two-component system, OmpR family, sensor kinase
MTLGLSSLRSRLIALIVVFCLLVAAIFATAVHYAHQGYNTELRQRQAMIFARSVVALYPALFAEPAQKRREVEERFEEMLLLEPSSAMYVIGADGTVQAGFSKQRSIGSASRIALAPIQQLLARPDDKMLMGDDPEFPGEKCPFAAAPLPSGGYLYVLMRMEKDDNADALAISYANRTALQVSLVGALLSAILVWAVISQLTRPLRGLTAAADAVREADVQVDEKGQTDAAALPHLQRNDEIGLLARAFRDMVLRLRTQVQRVKQMDANRRDWIASISHDLRTPLTSLTGHLETVLLRGERMTEPERQRFLEVALANARQLDRLSASLFDFARLDSDEVRLEKSPAALGELLDDIAARFATAAEQKQVRLISEWPDGLPMLRVDAALLERALANLVDNALRYTPAGGSVTLRASADDKGVTLQVIDTGPGIAAEDLPRVFDKFFQGTRHREGRGHAGLGLAIVKRVAALHEGHVRAANRPESEGGGAQFSLWLPRAA